MIMNAARRIMPRRISQGVSRMMLWQGVPKPYHPQQPMRYASGVHNGGKESSLESPSPLLVSEGDVLYLHVGPSGDFWTGHSLFAAKHLQPDYVKSIKLEEGIDVDILLELLEEDIGGAWAHYIYDEGRFPIDLVEKLQEEQEKE